MKFRTKFLSVFSLIIFVTFFVFCSFDLEVNALTSKQSDKLIDKIAKDFSKKFFNGIGFGLSEESALNFAMKENIEIFKKKKGIENIDTKAIAQKASISIIDNCGYSLKNLEDEWGLTLNKSDLD